MTNTLTYAGIFDDQVHRYPGGFFPPVGSDKTKRDEFFNKLLLHSLYFGRPLAINDGYMLQHPFLTDSVRNRNSFLRVLGRNGYIALLRRKPEEPLSKLVEFGKELHIGSLAAVPESQQNPAQWDALAFHLDEFEKDVKAPNPTCGGMSIGIKRWPNRDTAAAFNAIMLSLLDDGRFPSDLLNEGRFEYKKIKATFSAYVSDPGSVIKNGKIPPPRTFWEQLVKRVYREDSPPTHLIQNSMGRRFMEVANCVYHFNQAATFDAQGERFDVSTSAESTALNFCVRSQEIEPDIKAIPEVRIPGDLFKADPKLIEAFLANNDLFDAKTRYLSAVDHYLDTLCDYDQLKQVSATYSRELDKFARPDAAKGLPLETFIKMIVGPPSIAIAWLSMPPACATVSTFCTILTAFGGSAIRRIGRVRNSRTVQPAIGSALDTQTPSRQLFLRPTGTHYDERVAHIRTLPELFRE